MDQPTDSTASIDPNHAGEARSVAGLRVLVVGLGRFGGGTGVTRWLAEQDAIVTVTDQAPRATLVDSLSSLDGLDLTFHLGGHDQRDLEAVDLVVVNPAVNKAKSEFFQAIRRRGIPWTTEMNLFCERCPAKIIGVTGTFGKSTTCAMLVEVLEKCQPEDAGWTGVHFGGNIGCSLLTDLSGIRATDLVVLEMSNAQLEDLPRIRWAPPIALITNLTPHHLDRYAGYEGYVAAKLNITDDPREQSRVLVGDLDPEAAEALRRQVARYDTRVMPVQPLDPPAELQTPGAHNQANAACAVAIARYLGLAEIDVRTALRMFSGLPHRLEFVRTVQRVDYYNDSKSTSPATTERAVSVFERPIVAIVGGQAKNVPLEECAASLAGGCRVVICTGESGPLLARAVRGARQGSKPSVAETPNLAEAIQLAAKRAHPGDVVLYSPGAPSFDAYSNYVERGRHFADLIQAL